MSRPRGRIDGADRSARHEAAAPRSRRAFAGLVGAVVLGSAAVRVVGGWSRDRLGAEVAAAARPGDIQMIASVSCVYCAQARSWFQRHGVPFTECLIERDATCAAKYEALMTPGTPVMFVRGRRLLGFSAQAVADALGARAL